MSVQDTRRSCILVSRQRAMGMSGCGSTHVASISEGERCANFIYRWYAMRSPTTSMAPPFPLNRTRKSTHKSDDWPEWFSHGWTLQEMIVPNNVQLFNSDWTSIGDKKTPDVQGRPIDVVVDDHGLSPCHSQVISLPLIICWLPFHLDISGCPVLRM